MKQDLIKLTSDLVRIPSVVGNGKSNLRALRFAQKYLAQKPIIFKKAGTTSYLWTNAKLPLRPKLLLLGHLDVVDVGLELELFEATIKGNILIGRGAGDMKGHIAVLLSCYKQALKANKNISLALLLTTDEEIGGFNGAKHVVESGLKPNILFLPDGAVNFNIVTSEKAPHQFIVEAKGDGGHAAQAYRIDNPLNRIFGFYELTRREFNQATKQKPWASAYEMTSVETDSRSLNAIPSIVRASFSWRWPLEHINFEAGRKKILDAAELFSCKVVYEEGWGGGTLINTKDDYLKSWKKIAEKNLERKVKFVQKHGASDARHFFNSKKNGTKKMIITSAHAGAFHSPREWVDTDSLVILEKSLHEYIEKMA